MRSNYFARLCEDRERRDELLADEIAEEREMQAEASEREAAHRRQMSGDDPRGSVGVSYRD